MKRPNVLIILTDQQSHDTIAAAGYPHMHTPNLDRLANEGALFTHAFCDAPICMPSRQSFFTGQYPSALNLTMNGQELPEDAPLVHHPLKTLGYESAYVGKLHFRNVKGRGKGEAQPSYGFDRMILSETIAPGFSDAYSQWIERHYPGQEGQCRALGRPCWEHFPDEYHSFNPLVFQGPDGATHTDFVTDEVCRFMREAKGRAWFSVAGFFYPHDPITPPARFLNLYDPADLPVPKMTEAQRKRYGLRDDDWQKARLHYYALVSHIDEQVGRLLACLNETGQTEETLVIFTADHGDHMGHHGIAGKSAPGYDSCSRVPLIMRYPAGIQTGQVCDNLVELVDVAPTILELCGAEIPPVMQGVSLASLLEGKADGPVRDSAFIRIGIPGGTEHQAIRTKDFFFAMDNQGNEELYDMKNDPDQLKNIASEPAGREMLLEAYRCLMQRALVARPVVERFELSW
jgi:arylsulfatase